MAESRNRARRRLSKVLNRELPLVLVLGLTAWLAPAPVSVYAGWAMVAVLILTPVGRIGWLSARWMRFDRRFAAAGWGLLVVMVVAAAVAVTTR